MKLLRISFAVLMLLLITSLIAGCTGKSTPPGDQVTYSYHYWNEGLAILIWHDSSAGSEGCSGSGSTEDPVYRLECTVQPLDGNPFEWTVHTSDGITADMWIDDEPIDLSQGNMFVIQSVDDGIRYDQYERDFSTLEPTNEALASLTEKDQVIIDFVEEVNSRTSPPQSGGQARLASLMDLLQSAGLSVTEGDQIEQPFFSTPGQILIVNGEDVQVFEYPDSASAENEAATISPSGSPIGTTMVTWVAPPHFYLQDQFIVLYVGDNNDITSALQQNLGEPIAEGPGSMLPPPIEDDSPESQNQEGDLVEILPDAVANSDIATLESFMSDSFTIGYWQSEGVILTPGEAVEQFRSNLLPNTSAVTFSTNPDEFPDLGSFDPFSAFGPEVSIANLIFSQGWGQDGQGEAILAIGLTNDSVPYWHGMIYAPSGFSTSMVDSNQNDPATYQAVTYENKDHNFAIDYPVSWDFEEATYGERASGAQFYSSGEFVMSAVVYSWGPKNELSAYADHWRQGWSASGASIVSETELALSDGRRAIQFVIDDVDGLRKFILFTEVEDQYLEILGVSDHSLLAEIAQTLRPLE